MGCVRWRIRNFWRHWRMYDKVVVRLLNHPFDWNLSCSCCRWLNVLVVTTIDHGYMWCDVTGRYDNDQETEYNTDRESAVVDLPTRRVGHSVWYPSINQYWSLSIFDMLSKVRVTHWKCPITNQISQSKHSVDFPYSRKYSWEKCLSDTYLSQTRCKIHLKSIISCYQRNHICSPSLYSHFSLAKKSPANLPIANCWRITQSKSLNHWAI